MVGEYLSLVLISFFANGAAIIPFINLLYQLKFTRRHHIPEGQETNSEIEKLHDWKAGTPVGGGNLIITLTTIIYMLTVLVFEPQWQQFCIYTFKDEVHILLLTFLGYGLIGLYDDWVKIFGKPEKGRFGHKFGISENTKFALQWILGLLIGSFLYLNLKIDFIHLPLTNIVWHLGYFYIPFAAFIIVTFSNAYNITDGLDGLSSGLLMIALITFMIIASSALDVALASFIAIWIGALVAFLYFGVYPARIWLGDAGALSFGATLGLIGLLTGKIFALMFIGAIYLVELLSSFIQLVSLRLFDKKVFPIAPLHHTFEKWGWEEPKIVMRAWLTGLILGIFGLWLALG
jgi:phospho-N-acetylmuramoyl-pentapeptide-transferase